MAENERNSCIACGWSPEQQKLCSYESHVKLFYGASKRGVWSIGSDVVLKERPDDGSRNEAHVLRYLENHAEIPSPKILRDWVDSDGRYFFLSERLHGETLEKAWPSLSQSQKTAIADEVVAVRQALRKITSPAIRSVNGGQCTAVLLILAAGNETSFSSDFDLRDAISRSLHDPPSRTFPEDALRNLLKRFPKSEPYVLTHCDLNIGNIIVKDGKLAGILDWEYAAYYPIWYEYVSASWGWTEEDVAWKRLLKERFKAHDDAYEAEKEFWMDLRAVRKYPDLDEDGRKVLDRLSDEKYNHDI